MLATSSSLQQTCKFLYGWFKGSNCGGGSVVSKEYPPLLLSKVLMLDNRFRILTCQKMKQICHMRAHFLRLVLFWNRRHWICTWMIACGDNQSVSAAWVGQSICLTWTCPIKSFEVPFWVWLFLHDSFGALQKWNMQTTKCFPLRPTVLFVCLIG